MTIRAAFIDRDGTINVERGYVHRKEDFEFIPGALDGLKKLVERRIRIYIVTNQAGIGHGYYTEADFAGLTEYMLDEMRARGIEVAGVSYCPHHPRATVAAYRMSCDCRKPESGLITRVLESERLQPGESVLIGDKNSDVDAACRLGVRSYLVQTGYGREHQATTRAEFVVADLESAVDHILGNVTADRGLYAYPPRRKARNHHL